MGVEDSRGSTGPRRSARPVGGEPFKDADDRWSIGLDEVTKVVATVLVLTDGADAELHEGLSALVSEDAIKKLEGGLKVGGREKRARMIASILGTVALDLQNWGLK